MKNKLKSVIYHLNRSCLLVWWFWEETHVPKVVSLNPSTVYWMDMTLFHIHLL